jgi:cation transporter-like permease
VSESAIKSAVQFRIKIVDSLTPSLLSKTTGISPGFPFRVSTPFTSMLMLVPALTSPFAVYVTLAVLLVALREALPPDKLLLPVSTLADR